MPLATSTYKAYLPLIVPICSPDTACTNASSPISETLGTVIRQVVKFDTN